LLPKEAKSSGQVQKHDCLFGFTCLALAELAFGSDILITQAAKDQKEQSVFEMPGKPRTQ
jgi:hypothetical protein